MDYLRFWLARVMIHAGLHVMPKGRAKAKLTEILWRWGDNVRAFVERSRHDQP